jgi:hypothetical protein
LVSQTTRFGRCRATPGVRGEPAGRVFDSPRARYAGRALRGGRDIVETPDCARTVPRVCPTKVSWVTARLGDVMSSSAGVRDRNSSVAKVGTRSSRVALLLPGGGCSYSLCCDLLRAARADPFKASELSVELSYPGSGVCALDDQVQESGVRSSPRSVSANGRPGPSERGSATERQETPSVLTSTANGSFRHDPEADPSS